VLKAMLQPDTRSDKPMLTVRLGIKNRTEHV